MAKFAISDNIIYASVVEGLEVVSHNLELYARLESQRASRSNEDNKLLDDLLTNSYASILLFLARVRKYFNKGTASE